MLTREEDKEGRKGRGDRGTAGCVNMIGLGALAVGRGRREGIWGDIKKRQRIGTITVWERTSSGSY